MSKSSTRTTNLDYISSKFKVDSVDLSERILDKSTDQLRAENYLKDKGDPYLDKRHKIFIGDQINLTDTHKFAKMLKNDSGLGSVDFVCRKLILDSEIKLPSVDVAIYTQELVLTENAHIDTSGRDPGPVHKGSDVRAKGVADINGIRRSAKRRSAVKNGNHAGNLKIFSHKIDNQGVKTPIFMANGSDGQKVIKGKDGKDGRDFPRIYTDDYDLYETIVWSRNSYSNKFIKWAWLSDRSNRSTYKEISDWVGRGLAKIEVDFITSTLELGTPMKNWSGIIDNSGTSGTNAIGDSSPSKGGNAGNITVMLRNACDVLKISEYNPGKGCDSQAKSGGIALAMRNNKGIKGKKYFGLKFKVDEKSHLIGPTTYKFKFNKKSDVVDLSPPTDGVSFGDESGEDGKTGNISKVGDYSWCHPALVLLAFQKAKQELRWGSRKRAQELIEPFKDFIKILQKGTSERTTELGLIAHFWKNNSFITARKAISTYSQLHTNITLGLDYYGNPEGFVPSYSVALAKEKYLDTLERSVPMAIFSNEIFEMDQKAATAAAVMEKLLESFDTGIKEACEEIKTTETEMETLEKQIFGTQKDMDNPLSKDVVKGVAYIDMGKELEKFKPIEKKIQFLARMMQKRRDELIDKAEKKENKIKMIKNAMHFGSIACRVIPYGQPALGAIGSTVLDTSAAAMDYAKDGSDVKWDTAVDWSRAKDYYTYHKNKKKLAEGIAYTKYNLSNGLTGISQIYGSKSKAEYVDKDGKFIETSAKEFFQENKKALDVHQKEMDGALDKLESGAGPLSALKDAASLYSNWAVSESEIDKAYKILADADVVLKAIAGFLASTKTRQAELMGQLNKCHAKISICHGIIETNITKARHFSDARFAVSASFNEGLSKSLFEECNRAYEKIDYAHYLMVKAYEGYFLEECKVEPRSQKFASELSRSLKKLNEQKKSTTSALDDLKNNADLVKLFYNIELINSDQIASIGERSSSEGLWSLSPEVLDKMNNPIFSKTKNAGRADIYLDTATEPDLAMMLDTEFDLRFSGLDLHKKGQLKITLEDEYGDNLAQLRYEGVGDGKLNMSINNAYPNHNMEGTSVTLSGKQKIEVFVNGSGVLNKNHSETYALNPQARFSYFWDIDFKRLSISRDTGMHVEDGNIQKLIKKDSEINLAKIVALPPLIGRFLLRYWTFPILAELTLADGTKSTIPVVARFEKIEFNLHRYLQQVMMMAVS